MTTENKKSKSNKHLLYYNAYKSIIILLLIIILSIFIKFIADVKSLKAAFEIATPNLEKNLSAKIEIGTKDVLNHIAINDKISAPNSEVVLSKAKKYEYLKLIDQELNNFKSGNISLDNLMMLRILENQNIDKALDSIQILWDTNAGLVADDKELAKTMLSNLKLSTALLVMHDRAHLTPGSGAVLETIKSKILGSLTKLIQIESTADNKQKGNNDVKLLISQSKNLGYYLIEKAEYGILLDILNTHNIIEELDFIFDILQFKYEVKENLVLIKQFLLE